MNKGLPPLLKALTVLSAIAALLALVSRSRVHISVNFTDESTYPLSIPNENSTRKPGLLSTTQTPLPENVRVMEAWLNWWGHYYNNTYGRGEVFSPHFWISPNPFDKFLNCNKSAENHTKRTTLVTLSSNFEQLKDALMNWWQFFLQFNEMPVVIFFELSSAGAMDLKILTDIYEHVTIQFVNGSGRGFMNRFLGKDLYFHSAVQNYKYILRLDADVSFLGEVRYNIEEIMERNGFTVGYSMLGMPEIGMKLNDEFVNTAFSWWLSRGILPTSNNLNLYGPFGVHDTILAGPFELYKKDIFANDLYQQWYDALNIQMLIHDVVDSIREQFFKTIFIKMTVSPDKMHWFCDIGFHHKINFPARCRHHCL